MSASAIILAGGRGFRATGKYPELPKQLRVVGEKPLFLHAVEVFTKHPGIRDVVLVIPSDFQALFTQVLTGDLERVILVSGGSTRQESARIGLETLREKSPRNVLIHDAVRPFITHALIDAILGSLETNKAVLPALPVTDALKRVVENRVTETCNRENIFAAQTPQGFLYDTLHAAHLRAAAEGREDFPDDASLIEWIGEKVHVILGDSKNIKLTTAQDIIAANSLSLLAQCPIPMETRTGHGFDAHRFTLQGNAKKITLCGVELPHERNLIGHSDADVGLHALTDAILGAIGDGDIGTHFPPGMPRWKGTDSSHFLHDAAKRVKNLGGKMIHLDVTLICETPKIAPYRELMRMRIADIALTPVSRVSVKATTTEGMGFTGRSEGIAAMATATICLPTESPS